MGEIDGIPIFTCLRLISCSQRPVFIIGSYIFETILNIILDVMNQLESRISILRHYLGQS